MTRSGSIDRSYDPAFEAAVEDGCLSSRQALERGDREQYVLRIVKRYGLDHDVAVDVTDNRLRLFEALRQRTEAKNQVSPSIAYEACDEAGVRGTPRAVWLSVALALTAASFGITQFPGVQPRSSPQKPVALTTVMGDDSPLVTTAMPISAPEPVSPPVRAAVVERAPDGTVVRVHGVGPVAVLDAFCATSERFAAVTLRPTVPASPTRRLGVIRDHHDLYRPGMIEIVRDRASGRWVAGDGDSALVATPVPDQLVKHFR